MPGNKLQFVSCPDCPGSRCIFFILGLQGNDRIHKRIAQLTTDTTASATTVLPTAANKKLKANANNHTLVLHRIVKVTCGTPGTKSSGSSVSTVTENRGSFPRYMNVKYTVRPWAQPVSV